MAVMAAFSALAAGSAACAGEKPQERISMPFDCSVEKGRIKLVPSKEYSYAIVGSRQERAVLSCGKGSTVNCRTMIAHKFAMTCGAAKVAWVDVAEAIGGRRSSRVWRADDSLHITIVDTDVNELPAGTPCDGAAAVTPDLGRMVEPVAAKPCTTRATAETHFVMPPGFAPLTHFGAHVLFPSAAAPSTMAAMPPAGLPSAMPDTRRMVITATAPKLETVEKERQRLLERTIITAPLPDVAHGAPINRFIPDVQANRMAGALNTNRMAGHDGSAGADVPPWHTSVVQAGPDLAAVADAGRATSRDMMLWLMLTSLIATAGWMAWTRPQRLTVVARQFVRIAPIDRARTAIAGHLSGWAAPRFGVTRNDAESAPVYPAQAIENVLNAVSKIVASVDPKLPLRRVLDDETRRVRQRLSVAKSAAGGSDDACIPAPAYRVLMRDLERIRRIGESAKASIQTGDAQIVQAQRMPASREDAFDVLGINPNVSEATIKKVVDALRMSWHPDLATDEQDRLVREERIKQINIAMELISEKRRVA